MKISYNWLKQYLDFDKSPEETSQILTDCGLEVEGLEAFSSVEGGLEGLVIGEVLTVTKHPDADRLNITTVNIGTGEPKQIVCGAPNVAVGQKVVVATPGCTLYPSGGESFAIKKGKIRGADSEGMICAEDEIGLGKGHDGIMVLDPAAQPGSPASSYFKVETDTVFEIGLTPNRADGASHLGVARDLAAVLSIGQAERLELKRPHIGSFSVNNHELTVNVQVEDADACPRYAGVTISGVTVKASPEWLQNRLRSIGVGPINNVVDVTNYVLHELGQPLHAFDAAVTGKTVIVKQLPEGTPFVTLDGVERKLSAHDLMICNATGGMCIAGVFGGIASGVSEKTTQIFLESAYFNPVSVRKTAKRHALNTDASFRFERGVDPNITVFALQRAALLIQEVAGGTVSSAISDYYPKPIQPFSVELGWANCDRLIGKKLDRDLIKQILTGLEIEVENETEAGLRLTVPPVKVDVQREADVIEEVLRVYGYNNVEIPNKVNSSLSYTQKPNREKVRNTISDLLSSNGFNEIMSNSLTRSSYYKNNEQWPESACVPILNPLSTELDVMRQTLFFTGMETLARNQNHREPDLRLYEFGRAYSKAEKGYREQEKLAIYLTGRKESEGWNTTDDQTDFYALKGVVEAVFSKLGISSPGIKTSDTSGVVFSSGLSMTIINREVAQLGKVRPSILEQFGLRNDVWFADINWDVVTDLLKLNKVKFKPLPKYPAMRRDLALLVDHAVSFEQVAALARKADKQLIEAVNLFDVYEGKNLAEGKKSYAVSLTFRDEHKTLTDKQVDKVISKIVESLKAEVGAELR